MNNQLNFALLQQVQKPLGNIYLSIDMLKTIIQKGDQEIYLDVIARNVTRLEILVNQLLTNTHPEVSTART